MWPVQDTSVGRRSSPVVPLGHRSGGREPWTCRQAYLGGAVAPRASRGPVARRPDRAYWDAIFPHPKANDYAIAFDGKQVSLTIRGQSVEHMTGINLVSLMKIGQPADPDPLVFQQMGEHAIEASSGHGDPFPHNMLWSARGIDLIDADDQETDTDRQAAIATLRGTLESWHLGGTVAKNAYIRQLLGPVRFVRRRVGRVLRRLMSDRVVESIKMRMGI